MRKDKYRPDVSLEDVVRLCRDWETETGVRVAIVIRPEAGPNGDPYAEVYLYDKNSPLSLESPLCRRGPLPLRGLSRQMPILLRLVAEAYSQLSDPVLAWLWPPRYAAARVRGDTPAPR